MTAGTENVTPNMNDEEEVKAPLFLKILVVVLGLGILGMLALITVKIMKGDASKPKKVASPVVKDITGSVPMSLGFEELTVSKPEGSELVSVNTQGRTVVLHYRSEEKTTLILIDKATGTESRINVPE